MIDYENLLSDQVKKLQPSGIRRFSELAAEMDDVISLGVGSRTFRPRG